MGLREYVIKRIIVTVLLIWVIASVNFVIFNALPGTSLQRYVVRSLGAGEGMAQEEIEELKRMFGFGKPLHEKYMIYLRSMFTFNFGYSFHQGKVVGAVMTSLPNTLILMGISEIAAMIFGIILGVIVAYKRGSIFDSSVVTGSLLTYSLPVFWLGWIILNAFAVSLGWFPIQGFQPTEWGFNPPGPLEYIFGRLHHLVLPATTLFIFLMGGWILLARATVLETITEDYVVTAQAKGLKTRTVLFKHVLKNASLPLVTSVALTLGFLITGAIITETVFSYGGMGLLTIRAIHDNDLPVLQAIFFVIGILVVLANFAADLIYGIIDPRIKYG